MNALKCETCGAVLEVKQGAKVFVCEFCGVSNAMTQAPAAAESDETIVFALWQHDNYFYPGKIGQSTETHKQILFLDGQVATVENHQIIELEQALNTFALEGNFQNQGHFYKGKISGRSPMIMNYDDGDSEMIDMKQLRGALPSKSLFGRLFS